MGWSYQGRSNGEYSRAPYQNGYGRAPVYNWSGYNGDYRGNSRGGRGYDADNYRKKTGASTGQYVAKSGPNAGKARTYVRGWRKVGREIVTYFCSAYKKTKEHKTKTGRVFFPWLCKIQYKDGTEERRPCIFWPDRGHVVVDALSIVISPKSDYCGANFKRKKRR